MPRLLLFLLLAAPTLAQSPFDAPLYKQTVDLGPSPYYPGGNRRIELSCLYYFRFLVKQIDSGQKGADLLSITPLDDGDTPDCTKAPLHDEKLIEDQVSGYFLGARKNLVFFRAADGTDGGIAFTVYDSRTPVKLFQESAYYGSISATKPSPSPFNQLRISIAPDNQVTLTYLRVEEAGCDLHSEKSCWPKAQKKFHLEHAPPPVCTGYEKITTRTDSALAYPVATTLFSHPNTRVINGPIKCWPVD
jgi:hypothetical protein